MADQLSHIALAVSNVEESIAFYERWAGLQLVNQGQAPMGGAHFARLTDEDQSVALMLIEVDKPQPPLAGASHLGVSVASREEVDRRLEEAKADKVLHSGPNDVGGDLGYTAVLLDPDGNKLELAYGQDTGPKAMAAG